MLKEFKMLRSLSVQWEALQQIWSITYLWDVRLMPQNYFITVGMLYYLKDKWGELLYLKQLIFLYHRVQRKKQQAILYLGRKNTDITLNIILFFNFFYYKDQNVFELSAETKYKIKPRHDSTMLLKVHRHTLIINDLCKTNLQCMTLIICTQAYSLYNFYFLCKANLY